MSAEIDERIVSMKFDNEQFEKGIDKTSKSLDKFKKNMDFDNEEKKFRNFEKSINNSNLDGLATAADRVSIKFNAMAAAGYAAIQHIVDKAMNSTEALVKSLSIDQISAGWSKYAEKTESVQTIMAATGRDIETVNNQLKKLLWFADETSYSFTDMTNGIGKFTAAGQDLDKSVKAMQGISTWAAISGQKADSASRAIFNIAQAISTGYMGVADWKSIELANMATKDFKQNVINTAVEMGKLTKATDEMGNAVYKDLKGTIVTAEGMRETLKDKWFDSDVMVGVLNKYGGYADKLGQVYSALGEEVPTSKIIPDIEKIAKGQKTSIEYSGKAAKLMKELSNEWDDVGAKSFAAAQMAKTYNDAIDATKDATSTAWMNVFEAIFGNFNEAKVYWTNFANDLWDVFVPRLIEIKDLMDESFGRDTGLFDEILDKTKLGSSEILDNLKALAVESGAVSVEVAKSATSIAELSAEGAISTDLLSKAFSELKDNVLSYTVAEDGTVNITKTAIKRNESQKKSIQSVVNSIANNKEAYEELMEAYATKTGREYMFDTIHNVLESIASISDKIAAGWAKVFPVSGEKIYNILVKMAGATEAFLNKLDEEGVTKKLEGVGQGVASVVKIIGNVINALWTGVKKVTNALGLSSEKIFGFADKIGYFLMGLENATRDMNILTSVFETIASVVSAVMRPIKEFFGYINEEFNKAIIEGEELHPIVTNLKNTFKGLGDIFRIVSLLITKVLNGFSSLIGSATPTSSAIGAIAEAIFAVTGKIGEFISNIYEVIKNSTVLQTVFGYLGTGIKFLISVFSGLGEIVVNTFNKIFNKIPKLSLFGKSSEKAAVGLNKFKEAASGTLETFNKWKQDMAKKPSAFIEGIGVFFGKIGEFFGKVKDWLAPVGEYLKRQFGPIWNNFKEWVTNIDFKGFTDFAMWLQTMFNGGLFSAILITVNRLFNTVDKKMKQVGTWHDVVDRFFKSIGGGIAKALTGLGNKLNAEALHEMAEAILMLVGAMAILTFFPMDKLTVVGGMLVGIVEALAGAMRIMSASMGGQQGRLSARFGGFQMAIKAPLEALSDMGQAVKINSIKQIAIAVAIIAGAMAGLAVVMKKFDIDEATIAAIGGIMVGAMMAVSAVLAIIDRLSDKGGDDNSVNIVTNLNALEKGFSEIGDAFKKMAAGVQFRLIASSLLMLVGSISLMALTVKHLGPYVWEGLTALTIIFAEVGLIFKLVSTAGDNALYAGSAIRMVGNTIFEIGLAIGLLSLIASRSDIGTLGAAVAGIGGLFFVFAGTLFLLSKAGDNAIKAGYAMQRIGNVILIIGATLALLTQAISGKEHTALFAASSIGIIMLALMTSLYIVSKGDDIEGAGKAINKVAGSLIAIGAVLGILTAVVYNNGGATELLGAVEAISMILLELSAAIGIISEVEDADDAATSILKLSGALLAIAAALGIVSAIGAGNALAAVGVLSVGMLALVGFTALLSPLIGTLTAISLAFRNFGMAIIFTGGGVALVAAGIMLFVGAMKLMATVSIEAAKTAGDAIMAFITALVSGMPMVITAIGNAITSLFKMLAGIMPSIGEFVTALIGMIVKALYDNIGNIAMTIVQLFIDILIIVKDNIGQIVELILEIVVNIINSMAKNVDKVIFALMNLFGNILKGFAESLSEIDFEIFGKALVAIGSLAGIIALLATITATAPLALFGTVMMAGILEEMNILVPGLNKLSNELESGHFNGDLVTKASYALTMLTTAATMLTGINIANKVLGSTKTLSAFADEVVEMAPKLNTLSDELSGGAFDNDKNQKLIINASKCVQALAYAAKSLPRHGGIASAIAGELETLDVFAGGITTIGESLVTFCSTIEGKLSEAIVDSGCRAIVALANAADALPEHGGAVQLWFGDSSLVTFAKELDAMAPSLLGFSETLGRGHFSEQLVTSAATCIGLLGAAASAVPRDDDKSVISWVIGNRGSLVDFAEEIKSIGKPMVELSNILSSGSFNGDMTVKAATAFETLVAAANVLPREGGWLDNIVGEKKSLQEFTAFLPLVASNMANFGTNAESIDLDKIDVGKKAVEKFMEISELLGTEDTDLGKIGLFQTNKVDLAEFGNVISEFATTYTKMAETINAGEILEVGEGTKFSEIIAGLTEFTKFGEAISNFDVYAMGNFNDAMKSMGTDGIDTFIATFDDNAYGRAETAGAKLFIKFLSGMDSEKDSISEKVKMLINILIGQFNLAANLESIVGVGEFYGQGMLDGMKSKESDIIDYITELTTKMKDTTQTELDIHSPSRFTKWIGKNWDKGLAEGIKAAMDDPLNAGKSMYDLLLEQYLDDVSKGAVKVEDLLTSEVTDVTKGVAKNLETDGYETIKDALLADAEKEVAVLQRQESKFKQVGSDYMQRIADGSFENGYVVDEALQAQLNEAARKAKAKMETEGGKTALSYFKGFLDKVGTHGIPTSVAGEIQNAVQGDIDSGVYNDAGATLLQSLFGNFGLNLDTSSIKEEIDDIDEAVVEDGKDIVNDFDSSVASSLSNNDSTKIKTAVEKKVIPALDFSKSKKFRKTIKNAGKELIKAYKDSVNVFGDKKLKMAGEELDKLSKRLAKYYNNNSKALTSDKRQMTNILAHLDYLEKKKNRLIKQSEKLTKKFQDEAEAAVAAGDDKKVMELQEKYDKDIKLQDKKIKKVKNETKVAKELKQSYVDSAESLGKTTYYIDNLKKGTYKYATIFKDAKKDITSSMNIKGSAKKVVNSYIDSLYRETDAYTSDSEAVESANKNFNDASDKLNKLYATRKKFTNGKKKLTKDELKSLLAEIAEAEEEFREAGQELDDARKEMYQNIQDSFNEIWEPVRQNIEDGFDILKRSFETGIDLINASIEDSKVKIDINSVFSTGASKKTNIIDVLTASAETGIDIFSKFNDSATESTRSLLRNMKSQIEGFDNIATGLQSLKNRGVSDDMVEYIKSMGTQAASYIKVFGRMSSEQIAEANKWFAESKKRSAETLISNMRETFEAKSKYDTNIQSLIARGLNDGIINAIKEKGIEDQKMLKDYMNLTDEQIREANSWYEKSKSLEIEAKNNNIQDQLDEELSSIEKWNSDVEKVVSDGKVSEAWIEKIKEAGPKSRDILDAFMTMTEDQIVKMNNRLADLNAKDATNAADALIQAQEAKLADYASYQEKIATLLSRTGIGEAMRKSLSTLTINDMDKINAYLSMSDDQILKSNEMFEKEADYTRDALVQSYNNSIDETKKWIDELVKIGETMGPEIADGLMNMGVESSAAFIEAFKRMSPEEQREIGDAYKNKTDLSNTTMAALVLMMANKGKQVGEAYTDGVKEGVSDAPDVVVDSFTGETGDTKSAGSDAASGVADGIDSKTKTIKAAGKKAGKAMVNGIKESKDKMVQAMSDNIVAMVDKAKSFNDEFNKRGRVIGKKIQSGLESKKESMIETVNLVADSVIEAFKAKNEAFKLAGSDAGKSVTTGLEEAMASIYDKAVSSGNNLIQGLINGVNDKSYTSQLNKAMKSVMGNALQAARDEAGIHSPSKVAAEMGRYIDLGLAHGITSYAKKVIESAEELSDIALTGLSGAIQRLSETVENEIDTTPVIRPVMDLTGVHDGISALNGELQNGYNIGKLYGKASGLAGGINASRASKMSTADALQNLQASLGENAGISNVTYDNTFNITGDNPREIANQVSRILQQQVDRKGAVWA